MRSGIQETLNSIASVDSDELAKLHLLYRSSPVGRRHLGTTIINNYGNNIPVEIDVTDKMTNSNVQILRAYLLIMGMDLIHEDDEVYLPDHSDDDNELKVHRFKGTTYVATPLEMRREIAKDLARRAMANEECITIGDDPMYVDQFIDELADLIEADIDANPKEYVSNKYSEEF